MAQEKLRYVTFKNNCRFKRITPALIHFLHCIHEVQNKHDWLPNLVITSANDSNHVENSRHYLDEAWDIRTHYFVSLMEKEKFMAALSLYLNHSDRCLREGAFYVSLHSPNTPNEHIHVQVKKGQTYP